MIHATPSPRAVRRDATTSSYVDAAFAIVSADGPDALTMQRLAAHLGVAVGACYRYFPSKDALVLAVQRRVIEQLAEDLAAASGRVEAHVARSRALDPRAAALLRIVVASRVYRTLADRRPAHAALLGRWLGDPSEVVSTEAAAPSLAPLLALFAPVLALFDAAAVAHALEPGPSGPRALVLWGATQGVEQLRKLGRFGVPGLEPEILARTLVESLLRGFGAPAEPLADALARAARHQFESEPTK